MNPVKLLAFVVPFAFTASSLAQDGTIYPLEAPAEPNAIALNTGGVADQPAKESWFRQWGEPMVRNVTTATLTPFLPDAAKANGTAVIVAPGGGFRWLSINNEGWKIAKALNERGIAAFVLKYRLLPTPPTLEGLKESMDHTFAPPAPAPAGGPTADAPRPPRPDLTNQLQDAEAAYALILSRAKEWNIDPNRIGMVGFSAGAGLTMHCVLNSKTMKFAFIAPIYGGMGPVEVPKGAPPLFVAIASDDFLFRGQFGLIKSWFDAGRPVEFHLYQNGGHGFGMGYPDRTTYWWFEVFTHWLDVNGFLETSKVGKLISRKSTPVGEKCFSESTLATITSLKFFRTLFFGLFATVVVAQEKQADASPDRARANFARPITLANDDIRQFPEPPAGYRDVPSTGLRGRLEVFEYNSTVTGTRRRAQVYLPPGYTSEKRYPVVYLLHWVASAAMNMSGQTT